jgi:DNA-binding HxlR family transcriptional regulator
MTIDELIRKKGTFSILKQLKIKSLNYNSIKRNLQEKISARTLDFRLKKLTQLGILECRMFDASIPIKKKYCLTHKGLITLTCFESLENMIDNNAPPEDYLNKFSALLAKNANLNFNQVWEQLKNTFSDKKVLYTLKKEKTNKIIKFDDTGIVVETAEGEDKIPIEKIEEVWVNFVYNGILQQKDYSEASYRSSFMLALFSQLPFVQVNEGLPLSIKLSI